jgi:hypothetical protein
MSRALAILLFTFLAVGCHGQSGNPFMRTTVPPPATGVGAPSDPYYNNSGGPPSATSAPAATPMPGPAATVPVVPPPEKRFTAPGGYNFPQGSINHRKAVDPSPTDYRPGVSTIARAARPRTLGSTTTPGSAKLRITELAVDEPTSEQQSEQTPENTPLEIRDDQVHVLAGKATSDTASHGTLAIAEEQNNQESAEPQPVATAEIEANEPTSTEVALATPEENPEDEPQSREETATNNRSVVRILPSPDDAGESPSDSIAASHASSDAPSQSPPTTNGLTVAPSITFGSSPTAKLSMNAGNDSIRTAGSENRFYFDRDRPAARPAERQASFHAATDGGVQFAGGPAATTGTNSTPESADAYSHHTNYSWLRGKLEYSNAGKRWKLRYIPIDGQTDQYGGSVVLPNSPLLENFRPGEMVTAEGSIGTVPAEHGRFSPLFELRAIKPQR